MFTFDSKSAARLIELSNKEPKFRIPVGKTPLMSDYIVALKRNNGRIRTTCVELGLEFKNLQEGHSMLLSLEKSYRNSLAGSFVEEYGDYASGYTPQQRDAAKMLNASIDRVDQLQLMVDSASAKFETCLGRVDSLAETLGVADRERVAAMEVYDTAAANKAKPAELAKLQATLKIATDNYETAKSELENCKLEAGKLASEADNAVKLLTDAITEREVNRETFRSLPSKPRDAHIDACLALAEENAAAFNKAAWALVVESTDIPKLRKPRNTSTPEGLEAVRGIWGNVISFS